MKKTEVKNGNVKQLKTENMMTNQVLKHQRENVKITESVETLLIGEGGEKLIKVSDIRKLFVEIGGSPFSYLLEYNKGLYSREGWEESEWSNNFYSSYDNDKRINDMDEDELIKLFSNEVIRLMNYPIIGETIYNGLIDVKYNNDNLSDSFIPFSLVLDLLSIETQCGYYIVGCSEDKEYILSGLDLNPMEYFESSN